MPGSLNIFKLFDDLCYIEVNMFYVYILKCCDGSFYCGYTNNLEKRVKTHSVGKGGKYTRSRLPVELVYFEEYETKHDAMHREFMIKNLTRKQKEELINQAHS